MKKIIKILQPNTEPLIIEDENDDNLNEYTQELSKLLSVGNVVILETSNSNVIIRPHQITSIVVNEEGKRKRVYKKRTPKEEPKKSDSKTEDIITDG